MKVSYLMLFGGFLIGVSSINAQEKTNLKLEEAINLAWTKSNEVSLANTKVETKKQELQSVKNNQYPDFKITGQYLHLTEASIDLEINKGEYVALMGPSGSGKSTLMNLLGCLDTPTSGTYILNGKDVSHMKDDELAEIRNKEIGFVFQTFNLLPRTTALDNVALPMIYAGYSKAERNKRATEVLNQVNLGDRMDHQPNQLSGGQRQRVAIARALVNKPSIILADEPTGKLDRKNSYKIMEIFDEIFKNGNTIITVTQEEDIDKHARRIVRLRDGVIECDRKNERVMLHT